MYSFFQRLVTNLHTDIRHLHHEQYDLSLEPLSTDRYHVIGSNETLSLSGFVVVLARSASPYFMSTFLPTTLLTMTSFVGFLIPVDLEEGRRMALLITILLMLVTISGIERNMGPIVRKLVSPIIPKT